MIGTVWKIGWLNLLRDRPALALTFLMPVLFFSIFAVVFGAMDRQGLSPVSTALVFEDRAVEAGLGGRLAELLEAEERLDLRPPLGRDQALAEIRAGRLTAAVVVPAGLEASGGDRPAIRILADRANPIAARVVEGTVQAATIRALLERSLAGGAAAWRSPFDVQVEDVLGGPNKRPSVAFFAAGIGVMFLLFAVAGRGALLIEERQSGVLTRMLTTGLGLGRLLVARWLYLASLGFAQVTLMFVWGALVFGLDLWSGRHLTGFVIMTAVTAASAAGLALLLSVGCRTRAQLNGVSVVLVLAMSAIGGSMFPRFLMPESLQKLGLATFNAWALDGYRKVFWYESPLIELWPQVAVLVGLTVVFLAGSRLLAARWTRGTGA